MQRGPGCILSLKPPPPPNQSNYGSNWTVGRGGFEDAVGRRGGRAVRERGGGYFSSLSLGLKAHERVCGGAGQEKLQAPHLAPSSPPISDGGIFGGPWAGALSRPPKTQSSSGQIWFPADCS
nr:hypothetical protein [Morchella crassipes]